MIILLGYETASKRDWRGYCNTYHCKAAGSYSKVKRVASKNETVSLIAELYFST